jgi:hypothetical protein
MTAIDANDSISIKAICGSICATANQGQSALSHLQPLLNTGQPLEIDFTGVEILTTRFLNIAIGQLFKAVSNSAEADVLESLLHFRGLDDDDLERMKNVIARARFFHLKPDEYRNAIINSLEMD